jgi:drug/metabolite transporter (DMT)-like permease
MVSNEAEDGQALNAIMCMVAGVALLSVNDALIKSLTSSYTVGQLLFIRGVFVLPWIVVLAYFEGGLHTLRIASLKGQALRAVCVIASSFLFVSGLFYLPLADAIAISFAGPLFITALAPIVLGEYVGWRRWLAVLAGFAGVLFMVRPGSGAMQWAILFPLGATLSGVGRDLITRRIARTETTVAVLCVTTVVIILAGLATAPFGWSRLNPGDLLTFAANGTLIAGAHYLMIEAFRRGEVAVVAPFKYTSMIWAVLLGYFFFRELPDQWTLFGAAIVILAGLYILHRETLRARAAAKR